MTGAAGTAQVIVVGAGPVGLWCASELALRGIEVVVVERLEQPVPYSKALTIHPRTLEMFAQRAILDRFLERGMRLPTGHFGVLDSRLDFALLDTDHPYTLMFPQAETERLLEAWAVEQGATIRRGVTVASVDDKGDRVVVSLEGPDGAAEQFESDYVVGADGTRSRVRETSGIAFEGSASTAWGFLGDVVLDDPPTERAFSTANENGLLMIVPMPGGIHRIVGQDPLMQHGGGLSLDEFRTAVRNIAGRDFGLRDPSWLSRYGNAARLAERYRAGRILLAGDAAHMHFPAGGVGMNVGLQDAGNLSWRLADVLLGLAPDAILDAYTDERRPVGVELLKGSRAQTVLTGATSPDGLALREFLSDTIARVPEFSRYLSERLSGLGVRYGDSADSGWRAPDISTATGTLYSDLTSGQPVLVHRDALPESTASLAGERSIVTATASPDDRHPLWQPVTCALVRPDGYVAWSVTEPDQRAVADGIRAFRTAV
jgi:2-polyprenyl-6-methoxyphenol hydroxylase-like FAD-dependent oxidoreductase